MATMTKRQEHAANLALIAEMSGERYYRRMTFKEAEAWLADYEYFRDEGYPHDLADIYAWDTYFAARRNKASAKEEDR